MRSRRWRRLCRNRPTHLHRPPLRFPLEQLARLRQLTCTAGTTTELTPMTMSGRRTSRRANTQIATPNDTQDEHSWQQPTPLVDSDPQPSRAAPVPDSPRSLTAPPPDDAHGPRQNNAPRNGTAGDEFWSGSAKARHAVPDDHWLDMYCRRASTSLTTTRCGLAASRESDPRHSQRRGHHQRAGPVEP